MKRNWNDSHVVSGRLRPSMSLATASGTNWTVAIPKLRVVFFRQRVCDDSGRSQMAGSPVELSPRGSSFKACNVVDTAFTKVQPGSSDKYQSISKSLSIYCLIPLREDVPNDTPLTHIGTIHIHSRLTASCVQIRELWRCQGTQNQDGFLMFSGSPKCHLFSD